MYIVITHAYICKVYWYVLCWKVAMHYGLMWLRCSVLYCPSWTLAGRFHHSCTAIVPPQLIDRIWSHDHHHHHHLPSYVNVSAKRFSTETTSRPPQRILPLCFPCNRRLPQSEHWPVYVDKNVNTCFKKKKSKHLEHSLFGKSDCHWTRCH